MSLTYPANFILIAAMNPCPCGYYGHPARECRCNATQVQKYLGHISGPLIDRIDIQIEVPAVEYRHLSGTSSGDSSEVIRNRAVEARRIQAERYQHVKNVNVNADIGPKELARYCKLSSDSQNLLKTAMESLGLSARGYDRILKVSRTIADLEKSLNINPEHLAEAIQYRNLDRDLWM